MSADSWNHAICGSCWDARNPDRDPVTVVADDCTPCCFCGAATSAGIYVRGNPAEVHAA